MYLVTHLYITAPKVCMINKFFGNVLSTKHFHFAPSLISYLLNWNSKGGWERGNKDDLVFFA